MWSTLWCMEHIGSNKRKRAYQFTSHGLCMGPTQCAHCGNISRKTMRNIPFPFSIGGSDLPMTQVSTAGIPGANKGILDICA